MLLLLLLLLLLLPTTKITAVICLFLNIANVDINDNVSIVRVNSINIIFNNFLKHNNFLLLGIAYGIVWSSGIIILSSVLISCNYFYVLNRYLSI